MPKHWILLRKIHFLCDLMLVIYVRKSKRSVAQQNSNLGISNLTLVCLRQWALFLLMLLQLRRERNIRSYSYERKE